MQNIGEVVIKDEFSATNAESYSNMSTSQLAGCGDQLPVDSSKPKKRRRRATSVHKKQRVLQSTSDQVADGGAPKKKRRRSKAARAKRSRDGGDDDVSVGDGRHRRSRALDNSRRQVACPVCNKLLQRSSLKRHMQSHTGKRPSTFVNSIIIITIIRFIKRLRPWLQRCNTLYSMLHREQLGLVVNQELWECYRHGEYA